MGVLVLKCLEMVEHAVTVLLNGLGKNAKNAMLRMEPFGWLMEMQARDLLKYIIKENGELFAMMNGVLTMRMWHVNN